MIKNLGYAKDTQGIVNLQNKSFFLIGEMSVLKFKKPLIISVISGFRIEPKAGLEPATYSLRMVLKKAFKSLYIILLQ